MRLTAQELKKLNIIDKIIAEPLGGAHRSHAQACAELAKAIGGELDDMAGQTPDFCAKHGISDFWIWGSFKRLSLFPISDYRIFKKKRALAAGKRCNFAVHKIII